MFSCLKHNFLRVFCVFLALTVLQPGIYFSHAISNSNKTVNRAKDLTWKDDRFLRNLLAPTSTFNPLYRIEKGPDGELLVVQPKPEFKDSLYTEVVFALLAHAIPKGISEGPFEKFIEGSIGGNDFEKCRLGRVERVRDGYYALYFKRKDPHVPEVLLLELSELKKGTSIDRGEGAIIRLLDGTKILVKANYPAGETPKKHSLKDMEGFTMVHEVSQLVMNGSPSSAAITMFFTASGFQDQRADAFARICNKLIVAYSENRAEKDNIKEFLRGIIEYIAEFSRNSEISRSVQLVAAQSLTILSWMERGIPDAENMRVTADPEKMVANDRRGKSFVLETALPEGVEEVPTEGAPGFYWRGIEGVSKLGNDIPERLIFDKERFERTKDNVIMYMMDHGFCQVPKGLLECTGDGIISTIHETFFVNDLLPGSFQVTSTGVGHFQGTKIDIKQVTEGRGIQVNVRYNAQGDIEEVIAQELKAGDWTLALPGCVDYMINLGRLRFNDVSIDLKAESASRFNSEFDFSEKNIEKVKTAVSEKVKIAPYLVARIGDDTYLVENAKGDLQERLRSGRKSVQGQEKIKWISSYERFTPHGSLTGLYSKLSGSQEVDKLVRSVRDSCGRSVAVSPENIGIKLLTREKLAEAKGSAPASLRKTEGIFRFIDKNTAFIVALLGEDAKEDMLIRIPVEALETVDADSVKDYLADIQSMPHGYIELYSSKDMGEVGEDKYRKCGIEKKRLPEAFVRNRENTITLLSVLKGERLSARGRLDGEWGIGDIRPTDTIISPIGLNYDSSGFVRAMIFGLRLCEMARQEDREGKVDEEFAIETLIQYSDFCMSQGVKRFNLSVMDLVDLATGNINKVIKALNRLIRSLPIVPINTEELRSICEHAREALIRA